MPKVAAIYEQLIRLRLGKLQYNEAEILLERCLYKSEYSEAQSQALLLLQRQLALAKGNSGRRTPPSLEQITREICPISQLQLIQELLISGDLLLAEQVAENWPTGLNHPEALELQARLLKALNKPEQAMRLLDVLLSESTGSEASWQAVLELNYLAGRSNGLALATATRLHPRDPGIATHRVLIELADRRPGQGRRSAFRERILYSLGKACASHHQSDGNLLYAYDHTGRSDLVPFLHPSLLRHLEQTRSVYANVVSQLATTTNASYGQIAKAHAETFPQRDFQYREPRKIHSLRIGLISPDLYYHPVGRFVQMLLRNGFGQKGEVHLVNTGKPAMPQLENLSRVHHHEFTELDPQKRLDQIRKLDLDIAIDLAGWTGDNNGWLFARGLAPLQINYLGYYASSGLKAMDIWLGDYNLFPEPMQEWHSEEIVRLDRPFLAWEPSQELPEGRVDVPPAPQGAITFGCFNHVRKLSASTLSLWGRLLKALPGARLALKAFTSDDPAVVALLQRRMRRCGLDAETVIWLPSCPKPEDHLRQYGMIDIALDPFPNGGCTTTCEALWMGVPVITLCGNHYVSRMATAVLRGANLHEWVATSETEYLNIGLRAADQLTAIRSGRQQLRCHLQNSPLGNASDLADHLWSRLEELNHERRRRLS
ncbi:MAG: hypothetical protein KXJ50_08350 [Vulcanococcus sp.]|jgi:hypothetical protein|nr:hypothetical protein [Vulcanococcus sp.]